MHALDSWLITRRKFALQCMLSSSDMPAQLSSFKDCIPQNNVNSYVTTALKHVLLNEDIFILDCKHNSFRRRDIK